MNIEKIKNKIKKTAIKDDTWIKEAEYRQKNDAWLSLSFRIATRILITLDEKGLSQKDLADMLGCSPQYLNKIVKGKENLTLETICKLEESLQIKLIEIPSFATRIKMEGNPKPQSITMVKKERVALYYTYDYNAFAEPIMFEGAA